MPEPEEDFEAVDAVLSAAFGDVQAPPEVAESARARIARERRLARPSPLPEILDFLGLAATLTAIALLLPKFLPMLH